MSVQNCLTKDLFQLKNRHISDVAEIYMIFDRGPNKTPQKKFTLMDLCSPPTNQTKTETEKSL